MDVRQKPCLPCLWTKTNPDSTWNVMFLISFSENILFSLATKRRDRKERGNRRGVGGEKENQNWTKRNPEKCICSGCAEAWVEPVRWKQAGCQSVGKTSARVWLSSRVIYCLFSAMQNPHTHQRKACRGRRWSAWFTNCKILIDSLLNNFAFNRVHFKRLQFSHFTNLAVFDHLVAFATVQ